ncbi:toxin secretion/phage lysis holin [Peribacillus deserti]|uniref:Toxin secretion/phage lysis holin n=1 Tax=Peribacillus deserti TaxID=673318 RepID=A0ABS2QJ58_9BACI|nr:toxin secretion/phage lysis holin [Peribacillus deserti]
MDNKWIYSWEGIKECIIKFAGYLSGGLDHVLMALLVLTGCEIFSRAGVLLYSKKLTFIGMYGMFIRKGSMCILLIAANQLDLVMGNSEQFMRSAILIFLIGNEGASILKNLRRLGLPAPDVMSNIMDDFAGGDKDDNKP